MFSPEVSLRGSPKINPDRLREAGARSEFDSLSRAC
jgi:hypothetical protein